MRRNLGTFARLLASPAFLIVLAMVLVTIMAVAGPIFTAMSGVTGPAGVTPDAISFGPAVAVFATAGMLSVPAALVLSLMLGGDDTRPQAPRSGGPPL